MAPGFPLSVNGVRFRSAEALYQTCRFPNHPEIQARIIEQRSPMTAKMITRPHLEKTRSDWKDVNIRIMQWCLRAKLLQNFTSFSELLMGTGTMPIVEDSRKDDFWGAKPITEDELVGANVLGRLLMELREQLDNFKGEPPKQLPPLTISNFMLFGRPIGAIPINMDTPSPPEQARLI